MIKILFICHGNICRSPMAEFVFKDMVKKEGLEKEFFVASAATSTEEIGNPPHYGARKKLKEVGITAEGKRAVQMRKEDYERYDFLLGMDEWNIRNMNRIVKKDPDHKIHMLLEYSKNPRAIADPWYTGDFDSTYEDILEGCQAFLAYLRREGAV